VASRFPQKLLVLAAPGAETESDAMAPCSAAIPAILAVLSLLSPDSLTPKPQRITNGLLRVPPDRITHAALLLSSYASGLLYTWASIRNGPSLKWA
jgi:hypothetical protein